MLLSASAIKAMADSPTMDCNCLCRRPMCSIRAAINSCFEEPLANSLIPRLAASYSALICASSRETSLPCSLMCCMLPLLCMSFTISPLARVPVPYVYAQKFTGIFDVYNVADMFIQRIKELFIVCMILDIFVQCFVSIFWPSCAFFYNFYDFLIRMTSMSQ